ncbi:MAG: radical SAM family heme chaperone HemW [Acidobacteriia bacterium]|jgi:oxygen-independent coproporphyrinogen-3 oxidase|nr:radical SAM family heme chaperone HemW [Terriglobia bacterium]
MNHPFPPTSPNLGLYVHIPFCLSKCEYCHFASGVFSKEMITPYLSALKQEIEELRVPLEYLNIGKHSISNYQVDSIFFGGGTPSLIDGQEIGKVLQVIRSCFFITDDPEITVEVNPGTLGIEKLNQYKKAGVNRISIGVQSFQDHILRKMARTHTGQDAIDTIKLCRDQGIKNISLDFIAGLPSQTQNDWQENLIRIADLSPEHLSLYMLEIFQNTGLGHRFSYNDEETNLPSEEEVAQFYEVATDFLNKTHWKQYEISNFCKPGYQSRHNLKYWTDQPFIGFGCGAYSYLAGHRWGNERSPKNYINLLKSQGHAIDFHSEVSNRDHLEEVFFLGLRLNSGLNLQYWSRIFGFDLLQHYRKEITELAENHLIEISQDYLKLTPKGRLFSNEVFIEFMH